MNVKNFLKNAILFLLLQPFAYLLFLIIWGHVAPLSISKNLRYPIGGNGHLHSRLMDARTHEDVDILFLGSSHAYRGFDPRIFAACGIQTFNLGSSSQTPIQTEILLGRYLSKLNPKMIIYEVYPGTLSNDGIESAADLIANDRIGRDLINMSLALDHIGIYHAIIFKLFREMFGEDRNYTEAVFKGVDTYIPGGFVERELAFYKHPDVFPPRPIEFNKNQQDAFERIIKKLNQEKIKVVLVQAPIAHELYVSHINNPDIDRYYSSLASYFNFNETLKLSSTDCFYDPHHMNQNGVEIFNHSLLNILQNKMGFGCPSG